MGLILWLPMTDGTLKNQGLSNVQVTNHGATVNDSGKLGKCYNFAGTASQYIDTGFKESFGTGDFTITAWFKLTDSGSRTYQPIISNKSTTAASVGVAIYYNHSQQKFLWSTADGTGATEIWMTNTFSYSSNLNTWHHIAMVRNSSDSKIGYFYIDGVRYELASVPPIRNVTNNTNNMFIGSIIAPTTNYMWTGSLCDIRIYDEALSPREIKELSKGLVLHYPLNRGGFGGDNLLKEPNHNIYHNSNNSSQYPVEREWRTDNGIEYERIKRINTSLNPGSFSNYGLCAKQVIDESVISGMQVTISFWCRCSHDQDRTYAAFAEINTSSSSSSVSGEVTPMKAGQWTKFTVTKTLLFSYNDLREGARAWDLTVYGHVIPSGETDNYYFDFRQDYKVENGSIATPWTPSKNDPSYYEIGLSSEMVYDVSGFQNNGELVSFDIGNVLTEYNLTPSNWTHIYPTCTRYVGNQNHHHFTMVTTASFENVYMPVTVVSGQTYTFSVTYQVLDSFTLWRSDRPFAFQVLSSVPTNSDPFSNILASIPTGNTAMSAPLRGSCTFTASNTTVWLNIPGGYYADGASSYNKRIDFSYLRLETTEPDFIWESGSPRYSMACNIHSLDSTTNAKTGTAYIRGNCQLTTPDQLTIAFWCYARNSGYGGNTGQGVFCTTNNTDDSTGLDYTTSAMNHRDSAVDINSSAGNTHLRLSIVFTANEWHHYAFTYDGQTAKIYKDGEQTASGAFSSAVQLGSFNSIILGFSKAGGVWRRNDNTYSDLRVYATCLSEDDIKVLYQIPISLSSDGTLFAGEFVEG